MEDLKVYDLYQNATKARITSFKNDLKSEYSINKNYEKVEVDFEWLDIMEETVRYLDNILRNPNRFIINEEEVVKIEQARRTTVESIKHLSRHTNFIDEITKDGDVRPSKILNVNKDESYNTYENRLIYTLIQNMNGFIELKKRSLVLSSSVKDVKKCTYNGVTRIGSERVDISLSINSRLEVSNKKRDEDDPLVRIEKLQNQIRDLTNSEVYKTLAKMHVAKILPPVKKTNLILKNVNFQYAMKLWDYLQSHVADSNKTVKKNETINDNDSIKHEFDEAFLLNYLVINQLTEDKSDNKKHKEEVADLTEQMIQKIVELNVDMPLENIQDLIGTRIALIRNKREASISEIQEKIESRIQSYINKIESFRF